MRTLFTHIKELVVGNARHVAGAQQNILPIVENAFLIVNGNKIETYGPMGDVPADNFQETVNCKNNLVLPSFCDSHTHMVYAGI